MKQFARDICVVGGGPAGLAASIALARDGHRVTVADCAKPPIDKACGEGLMPDSIALLKRLGVDLPEDVGFAFRGIRFTDGASSVAADFPNGRGLGVRRTVLHKLLFNRADESGVSFCWGAKGLHLTEGGVSIDGRLLRADFVIGADGQNSNIRREADLDRTRREIRRYGFRRHFRVEPWSSYMELHWGERRQIYITPIARDEICVVLISRDPRLRLDEALNGFPELRFRLAKATPITSEMGALSASRMLRQICRRNLALLGDASGSIDAITGEGLCLSFRQAISLAASLKSGSTERYQRLHRTSIRRPWMMSSLMLALEKHPELQRRALAALERKPQVFASLLALHVGETGPLQVFPRHALSFVSAFAAA